MIKNITISENIKNIKHKPVLITTPVILSLAMTACSFDLMNSNNDIEAYSTLDKSKIDYNIDIEDREDYYTTNVEEVITDMSEEELNEYYIDVNVNYIGNENIPKENIIFLRSDNYIVGSIKSDQNFIQIEPGLYEVITSSQKSVGEMEALTPGKEIDLTIDYNKKSITYTEREKSNDNTKKQTNHKSK